MMTGGKKHHGTLALFQDLLSRGVVMSQRVAGVTVLVQDVRVGDLVFQAPGHAHMRLWRIKASTGGCTDDLRSKSSQDVHLRRNKRSKCSHTYINMYASLNSYI